LLTILGKVKNIKVKEKVGVYSNSFTYYHGYQLSSASTQCISDSSIEESTFIVVFKFQGSFSMFSSDLNHFSVKFVIFW
jgi:hypothetical protein